MLLIVGPPVARSTVTLLWNANCVNWWMYCKGGRGSIVVLITAPPAKLNLVKTSPYIYRARSRAAAKVMRSQRNCTNTYQVLNN